MSILYNQEKQIFTLHTKHTTYQMQVADYGILLHLYYGKKIENSFTDYLIQKLNIGFSGNPFDSGLDRTFSLDTLPQEFPSGGVGDYRNTCAEIIGDSGSTASDFRFELFEILPGAYQVSGMPSLYEESAGESETLVITMTEAALNLKLILYYGVFEHADIITRAATVKNLSEAPIVLEKMLSTCLDISYGSWELIHFEGRHAMERQYERTPLIHGTLNLGSKRGTSSHHHNPGIILCEPSTTETFGECYGLNLVYSGNFTAELEVDQLNQVRALLGINPDLFRFELASGETFDTPQAVMTFSSCGLGTLSANFHHIIRHNLCRGKYKEARRPVLINNWEATYFDFNEDKIISIAKNAADLGIEMLVLDDGWFGKRDSDHSGLGDWVINRNKLTHGLSGLAEQVNQLGMKFGLWVEPEMVSEDSDLYREHPDWVMQIPERKPCRSRNQLVLDMSRKEVQDYLFDSLSDVLKNANIEYIKWDMNRSICDVYSANLPKERQGEVYHRYVLGLYSLLERFVRAFPDVLLEGCSGGGGRFDLGMLYYSPQIWCSDNTDAIERLEIQYGTSFFYPISTVGSHVSASPNHQTGRSTPLDTRGVVAMAGSFGYEMDLALLSEEEKQLVKLQVSDYKHYYEVIQYGNYYRLTNPRDNFHFVAWQFVSQDQDKALINLVETHVMANSRPLHIKLQGLSPEKQYQSNHTGHVYTGSALMNAGLSLPMLMGDFPSIQLYLEAV